MPSKTKAKAKQDKLFIFIEWLAARPLLTELTLIAITVLFGMQVLRVLIPGMFWILGDRMGWSAIELGIVGGLIFLTGFLAGPLGRFIGNRRLMAITATGLGLMRLFMQVMWEEPLFNLSLAILGAILFIIFLPACFEDARLRGRPSVSRYALGLLCGLALDIAINGAFGTYDTVWQVAPLPVLLTLLLLIIMLLLIMGTTPAMVSTRKKSPATKTTGISMAMSFAWLAIGPFLFLELVIFQNIPRLATLTFWSLPIAFSLTLLAQIIGVAVAAWLLIKSRRSLLPWAIGAGIVLIATLVFAYQKPASLIALLFLAGQILTSALIVMVLIGITNNTYKTRRSGIWIANGVGMVLFLLLIFGYYAVYDISLPYNNAIIEIIAGGIIAACAIGALTYRQQEIEVDPKLWLVPVSALILLALPLAQAFTWRAPAAVPEVSLPVRVMTYNLHNGFNTEGKLNIEELAQVIENNNPDIVALQEVSRGWVVSGRLDMLEWLSHRLQMPYVFGPTAGPFWGNAILSRYPILAYSNIELPPDNLPLERGFLIALIDVGENEPLKVIATHLHHVQSDAHIRNTQVKTIIDFTDKTGNNRIILLGDLNAQATDQEMHTLRQGRFVDFASILDPALSYTFASDNPYQRIDYILTSYDLRAVDVQVPLSTASDHLPVVAVIYD